MGLIRCCYLCPVMEIIFWAIVLYIFYKFIFGFVLPLITATNAVRVKMKNMREQQGSGVGEEYQQRQGYQQTSQNNPSYSQQQSTRPKGDYIEFEEVK